MVSFTCRKTCKWQPKLGEILRDLLAILGMEDIRDAVLGNLGV